MANQDFDLKGWMQQNRQGVYKNQLNEHYVDLQPINNIFGKAINEEEDEDSEDEEVTHKKAMAHAKKAEKELAKLPKWDQDDEDDDLYEEDEIEEDAFGSREATVQMLEFIREDAGVPEGRILEYILFNWMSAQDAEMALRDFADENDLLDDEITYPEDFNTPDGEEDTEEEI